MDDTKENNTTNKMSSVDINNFLQDEHIEDEIEIRYFSGRKEYYKNGKLHRDGDLPTIEWSDGYKEWYKNGLRHRDGDLPAVEYDGIKEWWKNGQKHRDGDLPAVEKSDGTKYWYKNGLRHRDSDLPAVEMSNRSKVWYKNNRLHRDNGLPAIECSNGNKWWYKNGQLHRDGDLHAIVENNGKWWYKNGLKHRDGGLPAEEGANGTLEWWWFNRQVSKEEALELSIKYNKAIETIKCLRSRVKRYSAMCGLSPKKFQRVLGVLHKREFCEWWWHPDGFGGKNHLLNMEKMFVRDGW